MILNPVHYRRSGYVKGLFRLIPALIRYFFEGKKKISGRIHSATLIRGWPKLTLNQDGGVKCISCLLCVKYCPSDCLEIEPAEGTSLSPPEIFTLEVLKCISCRLCVSVCPVAALEMGTLPGPMKGSEGQNRVNVDLVDLVSWNKK